MDASAMTYQPKSDFLRVMIERGFLADCTDMQGLRRGLIAGVVPGYIGFDATAKSLHVGSLIQIMTLRWLQKTGPQADHADGRRHDQGGRSVLPRR
jgi:tyrosyl-tRNA synthetase